MKQLQGDLKKRLSLNEDKNEALKDKTTGFQIAVTALLITAILCIAWYLIKIIP